MLLKDNEEKRNIAWRTVMTVTSVLIILIVVFFAVKLFTSNPLTGNWENTDDGMKLTIKNNRNNEHCADFGREYSQRSC